MALVDPIPWKLLFEYNLNKEPDSKHEKWTRADGKKVYRFANRKTPMRIHILYEP